MARADHLDRATHLVLDLDPPDAAGFEQAVAAAHLVRQALDDVGLAGAVKTSGAKGVHVFVPIDEQATMEDTAAATRAIAKRAERIDPQTATTAFVKADREGKVFVDATRTGGATVVAAYSPRARPGVPVSFPVAWDDLDRRHAGRLHDPHRAAEQLGDRDPWADALPAPQRIPADLIAEGHEIPVGPRRRHARGQAAGPRPPRSSEVDRLVVDHEREAGGV